MIRKYEKLFNKSNFTPLFFHTDLFVWMKLEEPCIFLYFIVIFSISLGTLPISTKIFNKQNWKLKTKQGFRQNSERS